MIDKKNKIKLALIIPTKNRPKEITRLLLSIRDQSVKSVQIIIVNGGSICLKQVLQDFTDLNINYLTSNLSLTLQRNLGIKFLLPTITHVGFLDDDIFLKKWTLEKMLSFWLGVPSDIGGVGFNITDGILRGPINFLKWPFFTGNKQIGRILPSGYNTPYCPAKKNCYVDWLFGGATVWRREVLDEFKFDEWYKGYAFLEDVDFSYAVSKKYKLIVLAEARVRHLSAQDLRVGRYVFGRHQIINRYYFVKKNPELSVLCFLWASIGLLLENILKGIVRLKLAFFYRSLGNIAGLSKIISGKIKKLISKNKS